ncbi:protein FAM185A isoform 2-T2 [Rhinophrynus dorsalis]
MAMMGTLVYRGRSWLRLAGKSTWAVTVGRWKGNRAAESMSKPLKQWTLIVNPLSSLRVRLPCNVRVTPQDPLTYPDADRVFVMVSGVDRNVHRGLDLDNIEVKYDEVSRQVLINSQDIDSLTCVDVTTPVRFDVDIKTTSTGCVSVNKIECDNCHIETEKGDSVLQSVKTVDIEKLLGTSINICTEGGQLKARYLYAESSSMSSASGDIILGSAHGEIKLHTEQGNITVDSLDGCLKASTRHGAIDVYVSQGGKVHLKSEEGCITVKMPATLETSVQLSGASVDVSPEIRLQEIQNTTREGQATLTASMNLVNTSKNWIEAEARRGTVSLKYQDWFQSLKLHTT